MNHSFDVEIAKKFGMVEAILIANFQFWTAKNKANGENFHNGRTWTYNSVRAYAALFPYLTYSKVRRALERLSGELGVLVVGNYNARAIDQTKWFAFADEDAFLPGIPHLSPATNASAKTDKPLGTGDKPVVAGDKSLITTDVNTDGRRASRLPADWVLPKAYGVWAQAEFPAWNADHVRRVATMFKNHWIAASGQGARKMDWFATWQNWCLKEPAVPGGAKAAFGAAPLAWYESDAGIIAKARERGLAQQPGERMGDLRWRVEDHLRDAVLGNAPDVPVAARPAAPPPPPESKLSKEARDAGRAAMRAALQSKVVAPHGCDDPAEGHRAP